MATKTTRKTKKPSIDEIRSKLKKHTFDTSTYIKLPSLARRDISTGRLIVDSKKAKHK